MNCYKCGAVEVREEFERCPPCEAEHKRLCAELDAKPRQQVERIKEDLIVFKETKNGIEVTTRMTRDEAKIWGLKIPE